MTTLNLSTAIHVWEDTEQNFDIRTILTQAGYDTAGALNISSFQVRMPDGSTVRKDTPLFGLVDADTIYVRPGSWATNYNGNFSTVEVVVDNGQGNVVTLRLQVIIDPVNDAPTGADKSFDLLDGNAVVLGQADFGFQDVVEKNAFKSVIISTPPAAGQLLLNGSAVTAGTEITLAEIQAGKVSFVPDQGIAGNFQVGFHVRDDGGTVGTGANDTSVAQNYLTFKVPMAHLGNLVWEDSNGNGVQDAGEAGIAGVTVQLKDAAGAVVGSTTTDASGNYYFDVNPGTYSVAVLTPAGYSATVQGQGSDRNADSDINAKGESGTLTLAPGATDNSLDAGLYRGAELGDRVWLDSNKNGVQDAGEAGVAGIRVNLLDASGNVVGSPVTTDANGNYLFTNLAPGSYSVQFDKTSLAAGYIFTESGKGGNAATDSDAEIASGKTGQVLLASGDSNHSLDAGLIALPVTLGDRVWEDQNGNGVQDAGEAGIGAVTVQLKDASGAVVGSTETDAAGNYSFTVEQGTYSIAVLAPAGYTATVKGAGADGALDSDIDASGNSAQASITAGNVDNNFDAGLYRGAELGDRVWFDSNKNGIQDAGEAGVAGVTVKLLDASGKLVGSPLITDANGNYLFTGLKPGAYSVQFDKTTLPANYAFTAQDKDSDDGKDSDASQLDGSTAQVVLTSGASNLSLDAGLVAKAATLGDRVFEDKNGNGLQDTGEAGISGVTVQLKDAAGATIGSTVTDASGNYSFSVDPGTYSVAVVAPKGYLATTSDAGANDALDSDIDAKGNSAQVTLSAGQVYRDLDAGLYKSAEIGDRVWIDTNCNGIQDKGEAGLAGVKVSLLDAAGNVVGSPLTTDANGNYLFTGLKPGIYSVQFDKTTLPAGYTIVDRDQGKNDAVDSDASVADGKTVQTLLESGESDRSWDMGVQAGATIGDRVWLDKNANGIQDSGESGLAGVTVQLKNASGAVVGSTVTDASGNYGFTVTPGTYSVAVTAPAGYAVSAKDIGRNDAIDSDIDASGNSARFSVGSGDKVSSLDAGLYQSASLGDKVWLDSNGNGVQDSGEAGLAGVKVNLLDSNGKVVASATTDASGNYLFSNLVPGNYSVAFVAPAGYEFTKQDAGKNDAVDSDVNAAGKSGSIELVSGEAETSVDAGLVKKLGSIGDKVWEDKNANGVQDAGETGIAGVTVKLLDASNKVLATTVTGTGGSYLFDKLAAGDYKVEVVKPSGYYATKAGVGSDSTDSDIAVSTSRTAVIALAAGENDLSVDAGLYRKASIGDKVWRDSDHDGVQDAGEEGIAKIKVMLYTSSNELVASTTTDSNGNYNFGSLDPGSYYLKFDKSDVMFKGYNMNDWKWGVKNVGSNDGIDSDVKGDMVSKVNVTTTDVTVLESGENDMSWDAAITPIVIDLNGDGIHTVARSASAASFDLLGTGKAITTGWLSGNDGFLAIDSNGNGKIDGIGELFGGTAQGAGFAKLATFDSNGDGLVDAHDAQFAELRIWRDANGNGLTDTGELMSLTDAGVASLTVGYTALPFLDANDNLHLERSSATLSSGKSVDMTDVYFNVDSADAAKAGVALPSMAELLSDEKALDTLVGAGTAPLAQVSAVAAAANDAVIHADAAEVLRQVHSAAAASQHCVAVA